MEKLTGDYEVLNIVLRLKLDFACKPNGVSPCSINQQKFGKQQELFINKEIEQLHKKNVIEISLDEQGQHISPIFLRPKSDNSNRLILNLKKRSKYMTYIQFKMDTLYSILQLIKPNCFLISLDMKDVYYSVPIKEEHLKYLKNMEQNRLHLQVVSFEMHLPMI